MTTYGEIIDGAQTILHDSGTLFTRDELQNWLIDGMRLISGQSGVLRTFKAYDVPPRHSYAITYEWEKRYVDRGSFRKFTFSHSTARVEATSVFEIPQAEAVTVTPGLMNVTQLWELSRAGEQVEAHYRIYLPHSATHIKAIWYDHKRLNPTPLSDLDNLRDHWWKVQGEPYEFTHLGRNHTVDIYEIVTEYNQSYSLVGPEAGMPTAFEGDRTYIVDAPRGEWDYAYTYSFEVGAFDGLGSRITRPGHPDGFAAVNAWEDQTLTGETVTASGREVGTADSDIDVALGLGAFRGARSSLRQYILEEQWNANGVARDFGSSSGNLLVLYASLASPDTLAETDELVIFPSQLGKYLKWYILFQAFNHQGEGYDAAVAAVYQQRFARAVRLMQRLANVLHRDASYSRFPAQRQAGAIPQAQLPSNYPRAPWLR